MTSSFSRRSAFIVAFSLVIVGGATEHARSEVPSNKSRLRAVLESWFPTVADDRPTGAPSTFGDGTSTPISPADLLSAEELKAAIPWRPTTYAGQTGALGWSETAFDVPAKMKDRVAFWRDIYAKYTTDQGVLHDLVDVHVVYETVDFTPIMKDPTLGYSQKAKAREDLVDSKRDAIAAKKGIDKTRIRFQLGQKDRFLLGIYYSGRYLREMEDIFRKEGLPIELTRLPFVESSFNVNARSKVGASGIWQFMPRTAKEYMKVNKDVDERNDPLISTRASARLLKQNYQMLESWALALTGYNHGAYGVKSIVTKFGTNDITELVEKDPAEAFGFASQNFYACFLAALEVERSADVAFTDPKWSPEVLAGEFKSKKPGTWRAFLEFFDGDEALAKALNPHVTQRVREGKGKIPSGVVLRVPGNRVKVADSFFDGKFPASKIGTQLKKLPMPSSLYSASSVLSAARAVIRTRLAQPPRTSLMVLPEILARLPRETQFTPRAPMTPVNQRINGEDNP